MSSDRSSSKFWGTVNRRERWGLSWRGRMLILLVVFLAGFVFLRRAHPFLAVTHRVPSNVLVVEGWVHDYGVNAAVKEFKTGHYSQVYATGGPVEGTGPTGSIYDTEAHRTAGLLKQAGIPAEEVQSVPACYVGRDRTYTSAIVLRDWFREHNVQVDSINVLTEDAHGRRTWLLFQEAMGSHTQVGIISTADPDYDASHWWRTSAGVREVLDEGIAYLYAKFFFWPSAAEQSANRSPGRISLEIRNNLGSK
jgi:hypothetical protein